ncbi:PAAR domain-containing protein [Acinetobacter sp. WZC-1]|uniref:PAAR domain-containing protein n=1 Tax=Acinetobacter sp. WZC-1 TaxID=3459034 RepID=UPI00403DF0B3
MLHFICIGDRTSGGGVVLEGNLYRLAMGRPMATLGMKARCCGGIQRIVQGLDWMVVDGQIIAYHGCLISCGCSLISSQNLIGWSYGSDDETGLPEQLISTPQKHHEFFTLLDDDGTPIEDQKYRMSAGDGTVIEGYTNAQGQTQHIWTHEKQPVRLELLDDDEDPEFDKYHITDK